MAGLSPILVKTQSLSLLRIADGTDTGKLILYKSADEVIVTIVYGKSVLGSTVVGAGNDDYVLQTAVQMVGHYSKVRIERIVIAGAGFGQEFYSKIQQALGVNVEGVQPKLAGINNQQYQEYIIPISLQLEDPLEPRDETTINLLPPDWVKRYTTKKLSVQVWGMMAVAAIVILGCFVAAVLSYTMLNKQLSDLKQGSSEEGAIDPAVSSVLAEVKEVNSLANRVTSIDKIMAEPQDVVNKISAARPSGVSITSYSIDLDKGAVQLLGVSVSRQSLIEFKKALEEYEDFGSVSIPLSSLEQETDIEYSVSFDFLPLKPQKKIKLKLN
jgi:hypothetical protein